MDIPRQINIARRRLVRGAYAAAALGAVLAITLGLARLKPAAPTVERGSIWVDTVMRGPMVRQVRGLGTLVPEEVRWIPAATESRVERIYVKPGAAVKTDTILLELSNPELELAALDAQMQLRAAEADHTNLKVGLESQRLDEQANAATIQASFHQARLQAEADEELAKDGLVPNLTLKLSQSKAQELGTRKELEEKRLNISAEAAEAQLAAQQAKVDQLRALARLKKSQVDALRVRQGLEGVLQQLPVQVGQRVAPGATLAKVADPRRLKAELKIAETQAKDIQIGQPAVIDTRNGVVAGHVARIDPAVQNGTVTVDVAFDAALPKGSRPDLSVDGTIELERLTDVLHVGRPAFGQEQSSVGIFRLQPGGREAERVKVRLGRSSVNMIEIVDGLKEGDQVILSDTSAWDAFDRLRLN
ncbi:MAG TPA: efflux RND transporter periplasmic adaptor subunit [Candidatus Polarisedimenticolia bacterium]|nr:efflux RND transporter periplasmic adaptor subunit [Candidatus Polarisedimenticolia bacterium]